MDDTKKSTGLLKTMSKHMAVNLHIQKQDFPKLESDNQTFYLFFFFFFFFWLSS